MRAPIRPDPRTQATLPSGSYGALILVNTGALVLIILGLGAVSHIVQITDQLQSPPP